MFTRFLWALARALLIIILVLVPFFLVPEHSGSNLPMVFVIAVLAGLFVGVEYFSAYPSLISFRMAPPFNRRRYLAALLIVAVISLHRGHLSIVTPLSDFVTSIAMLTVRVMDWAVAPFVDAIMQVDGFDPLMRGYVTESCSLALVVGVFALIAFTLSILQEDWPNPEKPFNVWLNFPLLDPLRSENVSRHICRMCIIYLLLGFLVPFVIPTGFKLLSGVWSAKAVTEPHTFIWMVSLWILVPMSFIMRAVGMYRVCRFLNQLEKNQSMSELAPLPALRSKA